MPRSLANLIAITVAFLGYKWFVFRTRGNYLVEWIRCFGVYGSSMADWTGGTTDSRSNSAQPSRSIPNELPTSRQRILTVHYRSLQFPGPQEYFVSAKTVRRECKYAFRAVCGSPLIFICDTRRRFAESTLRA